MIIDSINKDRIKKIETNYLYKTDFNNIIFDLIKNDTEIYNYLYYNFYTNNEKTIANYSFIFKTISLNIKKMKQISRNNMKNIDNKYLEVNSYLLLILLHEIEHAKQNYLINETKKPIKNLFFNELLYSAKNHDYYKNYYNLLALERDANVVAYENILKLLYKLNNKELYQNYLNTLKNYILKYYKINIIPNEIISYRLLNSTPVEINNLTNYEKAKYGLRINTNELKDLNQNFNDIIKEKIIK